MAHVPNSAEQYEKMIGTPIPQLVSSLAIPTTISMLVTVIYNTADTYFVSQINKSASAAVGMVYTIMAILHDAHPDGVAPRAEQKHIDSAPQVVDSRRMKNLPAGIAEPHGKRNEHQQAQGVQKASFRRFAHAACPQKLVYL